MLRESNKRGFDSSQLTLAQARFVIERALEDGKLSAGDLQRYHSSIDSHVQELHRQIAALTESGRAGSTDRARPGRPRGRRKGTGRKSASASADGAAPSVSSTDTATSSGRRKRAPLTITPERREMMRIQGQYLSCRRRLTAREQKRFTEAYKGARNPEEKARIVRKMVASFK